MRQLSLPTGIGLQSIAAASVTWLGAVAGWSWGLPAAVIGGVAGLAAVATRRWLAGALLVAAVASGWAAAARVESMLTAALSEGAVVLAGSVTDEPIGSVSGGTGQFVLRPRQQLAEDQWCRVDLPPLAVAGRTRSYAPTAGDQVIVRVYFDPRRAGRRAIRLQDEFREHLSSSCRQAATPSSSSETPSGAESATRSMTDVTLRPRRSYVGSSSEIHPASTPQTAMP